MASVTDKALRTATEMAARYITDRFLPDKAIDVIDGPVLINSSSQPASARKLWGRRYRGRHCENRGIPPKTVNSDDKELLELESNLSLVVLARTKRLASQVDCWARAGLRSGDKPIGSFVSCLTGVGKTG